MPLPSQVFEQDSVSGAEAPYSSIAYTNLHLAAGHENSVLTARSIVVIVESAVNGTTERKIGGCLCY